MGIYENYLNNIADNCNEFEILGCGNIGFGIPFIKNKTKSNVLLIGGVHAREYITTDLLTALLPQLSERKIDCVPMLNPEGIALALGGLDELPIGATQKEMLLRANHDSLDFSLWKANANAVDINVNFDADWGNGLGNVTKPSASGYIGTRPESEPETFAIAKLLREKSYSLVVAFHSKGEEVYWGFGKNFLYKDEAQRYAMSLKYTLKTTPHSAGGLKDYWVKLTGRLGMTVEVGSDDFPHPYPMEELPNLIARHLPSLDVLAEMGERLWTKY